MRPLDIEAVNQVAPCRVDLLSTGGFVFSTKSNVAYNILFVEDQEIAHCSSYQIIINRVSEKGTYDEDVKATILAIIIEFFSQNNDILLYICDTSDGKEASRNRLFVKWFSDVDENHKFIIRTAHTIVEGEGFYAAIIIRKDHPKIDDILSEFDFLAKNLSDK